MLRLPPQARRALAILGLFGLLTLWLYSRMQSPYRAAVLAALLTLCLSLTASLLLRRFPTLRRTAGQKAAAARRFLLCLPNADALALLAAPLARACGMRDAQPDPNPELYTAKAGGTLWALGLCQCHPSQWVTAADVLRFHRAAAAAASAPRYAALLTLSNAAPGALQAAQELTAPAVTLLPYRRMQKLLADLPVPADFAQEKAPPLLEPVPAPRLFSAGALLTLASLLLPALRPWGLTLCLLALLRAAKRRRA